MARSRPSSTSTALHAAQRSIDSSDKYRASVTKLHAHSKMIADFLSPDGRLDKALEPSSDPDAAQFIEGCKRRLKDIAEGNAKRMKEIDVFVSAVTNVKNEMMQKNSGGENQEEEAVDYEAAIHTAMEQIRNNTNTNQDLSNYPMVIEVKTALGEKIQQDDDLEIIHNSTSDSNAYKCPITGMLFEQPVRNKICGHTYSSVGLSQLLKNKKKSCPIPGCTMNYLAMNMVEEDEEMKMKVKRFKKREEMERKKREMEEEMGEEEMGEGGFTLIQ